MKNIHLFLLSLLLFGIGFGLFFYKYTYLNFPLTPNSVVEAWNIETKVTFKAQSKPVTIKLLIPKNDKNFVISSESFVSGNFGFVTDIKNENRRAIWSIRKASGRKTFYYQAVIHRRGRLKQPPQSEGEIIEPNFDSPKLLSAQNIISSIYSKSADIDTMVFELFKQLNKKEPNQNIQNLLGKQVTNEQKIDLAVQLLALAKIPARIVYGIELKPQRSVKQLKTWLEVYHQETWHSYSLNTDDHNVPNNYFSWYKGSNTFLHGSNIKRLNYTISVTPNQEEAITRAVTDGKSLSPNFIRFVSLFSLPIQTQALYSILLLIPVGILLLLILRNIVGIKTFGTFMPVLIALSFRETQLMWGIFWFTILVLLGVAIRFYLETLKLLLVPKLGAILTVIILLVIVLNILTHNLGLERGLSIALFPMVILTITIERMSIVWDERGPREAIQQGMGTLVVATLSYIIITNQFVAHVVFIFPEVLFILLALILLIGRYTGYRLSEIRRFQVLISHEKKEK